MEAKVDCYRMVAQPKVADNSAVRPLKVEWMCDTSRGNREGRSDGEGSSPLPTDYPATNLNLPY